MSWKRRRVSIKKGKLTLLLRLFPLLLIFIFSSLSLSEIQELFVPLFLLRTRHRKLLSLLFNFPSFSLDRAEMLKKPILLRLFAC